MTVDHFSEAEKHLGWAKNAYADSPDQKSRIEQYHLQSANAHATLALVEASRSSDFTPGPCPATQKMTLTGTVHCDLRSGHGGDHEHGKPNDANLYARWGS